MKKWIIAVIAAILIFIVIFLVFKEKLISSPGKYECEAILKNPGENKVDIVFLTNNVAKEKVKDYVDFFLNSEPFSLEKEKFNFFYAGNTDDCKIVENNILLCYSRNLLEKAASCPDDYVVVLAEKPSNTRSSSYSNVITININHPDSVFLHEFGHAFAVLADEYIPSEIPWGARNCAKSCELFVGIEGCYEGCSKEDYYRSSQTSVMRTLNTRDYKKLNTQLLIKNLEKYD